MTRLRRATRRTFRSLRIRNYRLFFTGQLVSVSGTWMQWVAQGWLVLHLTGNSGVALGVVTALQFAPTFLLGMWGGVIADRFDKRRILTVTQGIAAVLAVALGTLAATGVVRLWMVDVLAFLLGCVTVVDVPTRQAFVTELVGPDEVPNAVALNSACFNAGRLIGPALSAVTIKWAGLSWAFFLNGLSYLAVIAALLAMNARALHREGVVPPARGQAREGLRYVWNHVVLRNTIGIVAIVATFAYNFTVVLPLLAKVTFHGDAGTYGLLMSVMSVGAVVGALATAARRRPTVILLVLASGAFGVLAIGVAAAPTLAIALALIVPMGGASIAFAATANSLVQVRSDGLMRGRVMALYSLVFLGGTAVGGPLAGWVSQTWGARIGLGAGGVASLLAGLGGLAAVRRTRRRARAAATEIRALDESGGIPDLADSRMA